MIVENKINNTSNNLRTQNSSVMWHYSGVDEGVLTFMFEWRGQYCPRMTIFFHYCLNAKQESCNENMVMRGQY